MLLRTRLRAHGCLQRVVAYLLRRRLSVHKLNHKVWTQHFGVARTVRAP